MSGPIQRQPSKERIRGPNLEAFIKRKEGVSFEEALRRADAENRVLAPNDRLSEALVGSEEWRRFEKAFPCWTGTLVAYAEPGKELGKAVVYFEPTTGRRWVFPVPERFSGKKDCLLVAEHPDFTIEHERSDRVVNVKPEDVILLKGFPEFDGSWFHGDPIFDIPIGSRVIETDPKGRYLKRAVKCVSPVVRGSPEYGGGIFYDPRDVELVHSPSDALGVIVEARGQGEEGYPIGEMRKERYGRRLNKEILSYQTAFDTCPSVREPTVVLENIGYLVDKLVAGFSAFGLDCKPLIEANGMLGAFVTKELAQHPHLGAAVSELTNYFVQRLDEV